MLTVTGSGFPLVASDAPDDLITIDGNPCAIESSTATEVKCRTPKTTKGDGAYAVVGSLNGKTANGPNFSYNAALSPAVTAVNETTSGPLGGKAIQLTGTSLGYIGKVFIGDEKCQIKSWIPTQVVCILPPNSNGEKAITLQLQDGSKADSAGLSITYTFKVTGVLGNIGSVLGGTDIVISGEGFECDKITVSFGESYDCDVSSCTATSISCTTRRKPVTHLVDNTARHAIYGSGYKWTKPELTIAPFDTVKWDWELPTSGTKEGVNVYEIASESDVEYDGQGFNSGDQSAMGSFEWTFGGLGTSRYTSGNALSGRVIRLAGRVNVVLPSDQLSLKIDVKVMNFSASHELGGQVQGPASSCNDLAVPGDCAVPSASTEHYDFSFMRCLTPVVSEVAIADGAVAKSNATQEGTGVATFELTGSGFGTESCQNEVSFKYGDTSLQTDCIVSSTSATSVSCQLDVNDMILPQKTHMMRIRTKNHGWASLASTARPTTRWSASFLL